MGDGHKVLAWVVGQLGHEVGRDGMCAAGGQQQGVAVGCGLGRLGRAQGAARAGLVVHHQLLAQVGRHALGDHAGHQVGRAAGWEGHDHPHGAIRPIGLCLRSRCQHQQAGQAPDTTAPGK
ncbi:hypothetical protein D3C72_1975030 [compost metagenome]